MLRTVPWRRLPLTIRWLKQNYKLDFHPDSLPPTHMAIAYGPVAVRKVGPANPSKQLDSAGNDASDLDDLPSLTQISSSRPRCAVCSKKMTPNENTLKCLKPDCRMVSHTLCLARSFLASEANEVLPIEGQCPKCRAALLWGDLVRFKAGCYQNLTEEDADGADCGADEDEEDDEEGEAGTGSHWANDLEL